MPRMAVDVACPGWLHKKIRPKLMTKILRSRNEDVVEVDFEEDTIRIKGSACDVTEIKEELNEDIATLEKDLDYADIQVKNEYISRIIGTRGVRLKEMIGESNVTVDIIDRESGKPTSVVRIIGITPEVERVNAKILAKLNQLENETEIIDQIEQKFHKMLIGPNGKNIKQIKELYPNVQITFCDNDIVKIKGNKQKASECSEYIKKKVEILQDYSYEIQFWAKMEHHKHLIGKQGVHIEKIKQDSGAKIIFPKAEDTNKELIVIIGTKTSVNKAKELLENKVKEIVDQELLSFNVKIPICSKFAPLIIGKAGCNIKTIQSQFSVKIHLPGKDKDGNLIISGLESNVYKSLTNILLKVSPMNQRMVIEFNKFLFDIESIFRDAAKAKIAEGKYKDALNILNSVPPPLKYKFEKTIEILMKPPEKDHYLILEIERNATNEEIRKAYHKQAKLNHPDRHSSKNREQQKQFETKFKEVREAYEVLSNPSKREVYDFKWNNLNI